MLDPLSELIAQLNRTGRVPDAWREKHAPDGDLRAAWAGCQVPRVMHKVLYMAARAIEATQRVLDAMRRDGTSMDQARVRACDAIRDVVPEPPSLEALAKAFAR